MENYLETAFSPAVRALQQRKGSRDTYDPGSVAPDALRTDEIEHITNRDSFYLATVSESGWPYVQHRGGDIGFVTVLGPTTIGWIERTGNRQYLGSGNITADDRMSAIFVDYPNRARLKIRGRATHHAEPTRELVEALGGEALRNDGAITVEIIATDWNCPKYITPRYTADQVAAAIEPLQARIDQLETRLNARSHKETP
jgi:predicted pyridoxine 5'-phosphate oxidase superfamily flavin-nucleotide-binding protein